MHGKKRDKFVKMKCYFHLYKYSIFASSPGIMRTPNAAPDKSPDWMHPVILLKKNLSQMTISSGIIFIEEKSNQGGGIFWNS